MLKGVIGIDPGIRHLLTCVLLNDVGKLAMTWHYERPAGTQAFIDYLAGSESGSRRQAESAKQDMVVTLHQAAIEIAKRAATYHLAVGIEELAEHFNTSGMAGPFAQKPTAMAAPQAAFFLAPFDFFHADLATRCRAAGVPDPVSVPARYTSSICPDCGEVNPTGRAADRFRCRQCGYSADADENAAHVIAVLAWRILLPSHPAAADQDLRWLVKAGGTAS